jgi:hypothetical protein
VGVRGQLHASAALPPRKESLVPHWIGDGVGPRTVLDAMVKRKIPSPRRESNPRTPIVQPIAQRYTELSRLSIITGVGKVIHLNIVPPKTAEINKPIIPYYKNQLSKCFFPHLTVSGSAPSIRSRTFRVIKVNFPRCFVNVGGSLFLYLFKCLDTCQFESQYL